MHPSLYQSIFDHEDTYWWHYSRILRVSQLIQKYCASSSGLDWIDFGCGTGGMLNALPKKVRFHRIHGVEGSEEALELAQKRNVPILMSNLETLSTLPYKPNLVSAFDVLEHLKEDVSFLKKIHYLSDSNSFGIFTVPALRWLWSPWDHLHHHHRRYHKKELVQKLTQSGWKPIEVIYFNSFAIPFAYLRKFQNPKNMEPEFPKIPAFINQGFKLLSQIETSFPVPIGLNLIAIARKTAHG